MTNLPTQLSHPCYHDDEAARITFEAIRWPTAVLSALRSFRHRSALGRRIDGAGLVLCGKCREKFTVRVSSVLERSHIPMHKWLLAFRLMAESKKGISAHQLHRSLGIAYRSAWFMAHRIRLAMDDKAPKTHEAEKASSSKPTKLMLAAKPGTGKGKTPKKKPCSRS